MLGVDLCLNQSFAKARDHLRNKCIQIVRTYRQAIAVSLHSFAPFSHKVCVHD